MFHILVVEDESNIRKLVKTMLERHGYHVHCAENGVKALETLDVQHIDLIVLDIMMPEMDGYSLAKELREADNTLPILMLTAKQLPEDKKRGFYAGTDDYLTKPFDMEELLLRIKALLRRSQAVNEKRLVFGEVVLDFDTFSVSKGLELQTLPQKEFLLLYKLLSYPGKIFTRIQLMDEIWGMETQSTDTTVNVHINRLRKRFEHYDEFELLAVRGIGYKAVKKIL